MSKLITHRMLLITLTLSYLISINSAENPYLKWMSFYGFNPDVQNGWSSGICCEFWQNGTEGENDNTTEVLQDIATAYSKYKMESMYGPLPYDNNMGTGVFSRGTGKLDPNWKNHLQNIMERVQPFIENGTVTGYFLGDELCCAGLPLSDLEEVANAIKQYAGEKVIIYTNECAGTMNGWGKIPSSLDWVSFDLYDYNNGTNAAYETIAQYEKYIFPVLSGQQKIILVPGVMGCNSTQWELDANAQQIIDDLNILFDWAKNETRVAGFNPWHFNNRATNQGAPPCNMKPGAVAMPSVVQRLSEIGKYIMNNT